MPSVIVHHGDCMAVMQAMLDDGAAGTLDSVVCDPPYGLQFMGEDWDKLWRNRRDADKKFIEDKAGTLAARARKLPDYSNQAAPEQMQFWHQQWAELAFQLLKPGGYILAFSSSRTYHRLASAIEDAGFEVRDRISTLFSGDAAIARFIDSLSPDQRDAFMRVAAESEFGGELLWVYGSGFPKNHDVSKAIDKYLKAEREVVGEYRQTVATGGIYDNYAGTVKVTRPATPQAAQWEGWGTALKPAHEPIVVARKPMIGQVAVNVMEHGTGALNIDACRIETDDAPKTVRRNAKPDRSDGYRLDKGGASQGDYLEDGRFPANVAHDGSGDVLDAFAAFGDGKGAAAPVRGTEPSSVTNGIYGDFSGRTPGAFYSDAGSAARFFYSAKADKHDRWGSKHPTVKPVDLMRWLVRMVTPPGGTVLDPFGGSGSTGIACLAEKLNAVLIEREAEYVADIRARIDHYTGDGAHSASVKHRNSEKKGADDLPLFGGGE